MPRISALQQLREDILLNLETLYMFDIINQQLYNKYVERATKNRTIKLKELERIVDALIQQADAPTISNIQQQQEPEPEPEPEFTRDTLGGVYAAKTIKSFGRTLVDRIGSTFSKYSYSFNTSSSNDLNSIMDLLYNNIVKATQDFIETVGDQPSFIGIVFRGTHGNKAKVRTVPSDFFVSNNLDDRLGFKDMINTMMTSENGVAGSDRITSEDFILDPNNFHLTQAGFRRRALEGNGMSNSMIFITEDIKAENNDCGYQALLKCGFEYKGKPSDLIKFDNLVNVISRNDLKISVICNSFILNKNFTEIAKRNGDITFMKKILNKNNYPMPNRCVRLEMEDIEIVYLHTAENATHTIIYDEFNKHYDIILNNEIAICNDVFISFGSKVIKNDKILYSARQIIKNSTQKDTETNHLNYLIFDYETVIDFSKNSCMQEYSLSILNLSNSNLENLTDADEKGDVEMVNKIRAMNCITFTGFDCSIQFIKWLIKNQTTHTFVLIGFNNANFDNFILLDAMLKYRDDFPTDDLSISDIFYNGSQLHNFHFSGRHDTFDIHKHLMGSLKANCDSFKIKCCAKKSFDHDKAQQLYSENKLMDFVNNNDELKEYNEYDVLATAVLFCKYRRAINAIAATKNYSQSLHTIKTVGGLIYRVFEDSKKQKKFDLPKLSFKQYTDLQNSKIAGRVEMFNGVQKVEERLVSTDVCSLYPFVMSVLNCYYPCGDKVIEVDEYKGDDEIGFYYCDIDQSNLKKANLPNIYAFKTEVENNWAYEGELKDYLISNVMIGLLKKYGCKVVIKNGFIFPNKMKSCKMFDFLLDFMQEKNNQDTLKKNKNDTYNPALRETLKLLMNSLSGKVIEGLHTEKTTDFSTVAEYEKIMEKATKVNVINSIGGRVFISYEVDAEKLCKTKQRPIYLGVLVYDYAKRYMYENSYSKIGLDQLLYTDTDASKFRYKKFIQWKDWIDTNNIQVPHWPEVELKDDRYKNHKIYDANSKVFGSFEDELEGMVGEKYVFYCLEKKSWLYAADGDAKFRFKGLNDNAQLLTLKEDWVKTQETKHKNNTTSISYSYDEEDTEIVHKFYVNNKANRIGDNEIKFFEQIYQTGHAYLLCNSFRKIVKNSLRDVKLDETDRYNTDINKIQVCYMIKHISLKK